MAEEKDAFEGRTIRVAIVGGGMAGLTTALELTDPDPKRRNYRDPDDPASPARYEVTVYQQGWRLGGKGASGRDQHGRIIEHGLHVWMGFYENAFRLVRRCYEDLEKLDANDYPTLFRKWDDAFLAESHVGVANGETTHGWKAWLAHFPENAERPGDPIDFDKNPFTLARYLRRSVELLIEVLASADYLPVDTSDPAARARQELRQFARNLFNSLDRRVQGRKGAAGGPLPSPAERMAALRKLFEIPEADGDTDDAVANTQASVASLTEAALGLPPGAILHALEELFEGIPLAELNQVVEEGAQKLKQAVVNFNLAPPQLDELGNLIEMLSSGVLLIFRGYTNELERRLGRISWTSRVTLDRVLGCFQQAVPPPNKSAFGESELGTAITWLRRALAVELRPPAKRAAAARAEQQPQGKKLKTEIGRLVDDAIDRLRNGSLLGTAAIGEGLRLLKERLDRFPKASYHVVDLLDATLERTRLELDRLVDTDPSMRDKWHLIELVLAIIRGLIAEGVLSSSEGLDSINRLDCRKWLQRHGASDAAVQSPVVRALYNLAFADFDGGGLAAGQALRGAFRMFFTYRGALFWKMRAGMGDAVFSPAYQVLRERGVRFEFFHRLQRVELNTLDPAAGRHFVRKLHFDVQAEVSQAAYEPLDKFGCWPATPLQKGSNDAELFKDPKDLKGDHFESFWHDARVAEKSLEVGKDFDYVVIATGVGALDQTCRELLEVDDRWKQMVSRVCTMPTQSAQVWLKRSLENSGWTAGPTVISGIEHSSGFDTWADMSQVIPSELRYESPKSKEVRSLAYFCGARPDLARRPSEDVDAWKERVADYVGSGAKTGAVFHHLRAFLNEQAIRMWPLTRVPGGGMDPRALVNWTDAEPVDAQHAQVNVNPWDQYVLSLPGSLEHRISPLDDRFDNLTIAGDWTDCGFNEGCIEAAVMSGMLAAHAISELPLLDDIVGYDHP